MEKSLPLFDMSHQEFEDFCFDLLKFDKKLKSIERYKPYRDYDFDFYGTTIHDKNCLVEVKHWRKFNLRNAISIVERFIKDDSSSYLIVMTSAKVSEEAVHRLRATIGGNRTDKRVRVIGFDGIHEMVESQKGIVDTYFTKIFNSIMKRRVQLFIAICSIVVSLISIFGFISPALDEDNSTLSQRIETVSESINSLNSLEDDLIKVQEEMIQLEIESRLIKDEYEKVQELQKLTDEDIRTLAYAINRTSISDVIIQNIPGFIIGIATSLIGSLIYDKIRRYKNMSES